MANPKTLRTVSAAIPLDVHSSLKAYVAARGTTVAKVLGGAIREVVGTSAPAPLSPRQVVLRVANLRDMVTRLTNQAPRVYPPDVLAASSKLHKALQDAKPFFLMGDGPDNDYNAQDHRRQMERVALLMAEAAANSKALAKAWCAEARSTPPQS